MNPNDLANQKPNPYGWTPPPADGSQPARPILARSGMTSTDDLLSPAKTPDGSQIPDESEDFDAVTPIDDTPLSSDDTMGFIETPEPAYIRQATPQPRPATPSQPARVIEITPAPTPPKPVAPPRAQTIDIAPVRPQSISSPAPPPSLTIPVYSAPSAPAPTPPKPVAPPRPVPVPITVAEQPRPAPALQPSAPVPTPIQTVATEDVMFSAKKPRKGKLVPTFAVVTSLLIIAASGYYLVGIKQKNNALATDAPQQNTQVAAVKGTNTAATLDDATTLVQKVGDQMLAYIKDGNFDAAYGLTSAKFKGVTDATAATDVFKALQPSTRQKELTFQKVLCSPQTGDSQSKELTNESLCGGIYGFKNPGAFQNYYYITVITDYNFSSVHSIRGFEVSAHTDATVQDALRDLLQKVKQQVDS